MCIVRTERQGDVLNRKACVHEILVTKVELIVEMNCIESGQIRMGNSVRYNTPSILIQHPKLCESQVVCVSPNVGSDSSFCAHEARSLQHWIRLGIGGKERVIKHEGNE